jgi:hypothetical protein
VPLAQRFVRLLGSDPDDQLITLDTAAHVTIEQEGQPAEHFLFGQAALRAKLRSNAVGKFLVEGHMTDTPLLMAGERGGEALTPY